MQKIQPSRGQSSPSGLPYVLNCGVNFPAPHLTLPLWAKPGWLECINEELKSQTITSRSHISTKHVTQRKPPLIDGLQFPLSSWTFACHIEQGSRDLQSSSQWGCWYAQASREWQQRWMAGREPSWGSPGFFCLPIPAAMWHQPPPPSKA